MTTDWKSTIHHAYTTPNLLHPTLQKSIPNLIRDEIAKLANLTLFQKNIQANSSHSQVPVDMKFTDDSLNIRISKNAPWISLVPSTEPMSPEERAVDAVRRDVMEKIALLWGGIPDSSADESNLGDSSSGESSIEANTSKTRRTRSRRSQRARNNRRVNHGRGDTITISGNTIDSSTHTTTNNYHGCTGAHTSSPHTNGKKEAASRRDANTQTDSIMSPPHPSNDSPDESKKVISDKKKPIKHYRTEDSRVEEQPSNKKFKHDIDDLTEQFSKLHIKDLAEKVSSLEDQDLMTFPDDEDPAQVINPTVNDLETLAADLERIISKEETPTSLDDVDVSESEEETSSQSSSNQNIPDLMTFPDDEDPAQVINPTANDLETLASDDLERIISKEETPSKSTDSNKQKSMKRSMENVKIEQQPASKKLRRDSFEEQLKKTKETLRKNRHTTAKKLTAQPTWIEFANRKTENFKDPLDRTQHLHLDSETDIQTFSIPTLRPTSYNTEDPLVEISKFINEYDRESKPVSHLRKLIELQVALAQEQPDMTKINNLLLFLQADSTQNNSKEDSSDSESTLVASEETVFENKFPETEDIFIDDEIKDQPTPTYMRAHNFVHQEDVLDNILNSGDIFTEIQTNETQNASTQTEIHPTDKELLLEEKLRKLQTALERTKSVHKDELANLLRAQDRLTTEANKKIKKILEDSIENEKDSFSRLEHAHEKYNKLLETTNLEIADLKKALAQLNAIDLAKKAEFDRPRNHFHSPAPVIISKKAKVETKTQATQVEDIAKPNTSITESKPPQVTTSPPRVSKKKSSLQDRNLEAASLMMLRKEKAALEYAIQKNHFPKRDLDIKKDLLRKIDEELVRRNRKHKKPSTMTEERRKKTPLTPNQRDLQDLGQGPFNTLQTKLNNKKTNNK